MKTTLLPLIAAAALAPCFTSLRAADSNQTPATAISADADADRGMPHMHGMRERIARQLELTDAQRAAMKDVVKMHAPELKPLHEKMRSERDQLRALITAPKIDETALAAQADKMAATQRELIIANAHLRADLRAILTPDQLTKAESMRDRAKHRFAQARKGFDEWLGEP